MPNVCAICGNMIGPIKRFISFKDGLVCSDCIKKTTFSKQALSINYMQRTRAKEWASFHTISDFKTMLNTEENIPADSTDSPKKSEKQKEKENRKARKAEIKTHRKNDLAEYELIVGEFSEEGAFQFNRVWLNPQQKKILIKKQTFQPDWHVYDYSQLISFAPIENIYSDTKKKHGITRTLVGGALLGGVGALAGAASSGSKSTDVYDKVSVTLSFDDGRDYEAVLLSTKTPARLASAALTEEGKLAGLLKAIMDTNQSINSNKTETASFDELPQSEQLRELKQLLDENVITKSDFETKKKQILGI